MKRLIVFAICLIFTSAAQAWQPPAGSMLTRWRKKSPRRTPGGNILVYSQTNDVNGLITYDRKVQKMSPELLAEIHRKAGLAP